MIKIGDIHLAELFSQDLVSDVYKRLALVPDTVVSDAYKHLTGSDAYKRCTECKTLVSDT